jgi:uncharacterized protein
MSPSPSPTSTPAASHDHVAIVRALYDAFARRDVDAVLALMDPEVVIRQSDQVPWGGTYHGHEQALAFFARLTEHIETAVEIDRLIVAGDAVVEVGRTCGRALATGREFAIDETHVWRLRDGRIASMEAFVDNAEMLAALR